jgi:hypothetical protein
MAAPLPTPAATIQLILTPLGDAPRIVRSKLIVLASETPRSLTTWLRAEAGIAADTPVYLYCARASFTPDADEPLGSLRAAFTPGGPLVVSYSIRRARSV